MDQLQRTREVHRNIYFRVVPRLATGRYITVERPWRKVCWYQGVTPIQLGVSLMTFFVLFRCCLSLRNNPKLCDNECG
jgi:hypothetical protein